MNADDAIRFLEHEGDECRRRLQRAQSVQDAKDELEMFLLLFPPIRRRVLELPAMDDSEAGAMRSRLHQALRERSAVMTAADFPTV